MTRTGMTTALAALLLVALAAVALVAAAWVFQRSLIYLPSGTVGTPAEAGLPDAREVRLRTADGLELGAWHVPAQRPVPIASVLVCNGNAGNRSLRAPLAAALAAAGADVLLFDYRGFGGNPGRPSEEGLLLDARAARDWLSRQARVDSRRLVYLGESLGAGVATALASEHPPDALILRSPFVSLAAIGRRHYPLLPVDLLLRDRFPVAEQIARYPGPVLVVAGRADAVVPLEQSRTVADAAAGPARLVVLDAGHNDRALLDGRRFVGEVVAFVSGEAPRRRT